MEPEELTRAGRLRRDFDALFAEAAAEQEAGAESFLAVSVGGDPYALPVSQINGLARDRSLIPLPGAPPDFVGLAGLRGSVLPVWDLAGLMGYAPAAGRWVAIAAGDTAWAVAFEGFDGYLRLASQGLRPYQGPGPAAAFARQAFEGAQGLRPVLDLGLLRQAMQARINTQPTRSLG
jgi:purine-binding chemotaxis protein CheW